MSELRPKPSDVTEERRVAAELIEQELAKRAAFRDRLKLDPFRHNDPHSDTPFLADRPAQASVDQRLRSGGPRLWLRSFGRGWARRYAT